MEKTYNLGLIQQVRAYMERNHLSQNQLAAKAGLSSAALRDQPDLAEEGHLMKLKHWFIETFLAPFAQAALREENQELREELARLQIQLCRRADPFLWMEHEHGGEL